MNYSSSQLFSDALVKEAACLQWQLKVEWQRCEQAEAKVAVLRRQLVAGSKKSKNKELKLLLAVNVGKKEHKKMIMMKSEISLEQEEKVCTLHETVIRVDLGTEENATVIRATAATHCLALLPLCVQQHTSHPHHTPHLALTHPHTLLHVWP